MADDRIMHVDVPLLTMRKKPDEYEECTNQILYGETVNVLQDNGHWGLVRAGHDGYEGYVPLGDLKIHKPKTHKVIVPSTHIYEAPNFKIDPFRPLYFLSHAHALEETQNGFVKLNNGKWIHSTHIAPPSTYEPDHVKTAMWFTSAPYLWGGRSMAGIDCSGLVQIALMAAGKTAPRDSGPQSETLGEKVDKPQRGDLVFFEGHVGIMLDEQHILNATSRHMRVVIELLSEVEKAYNGITAIARV